MIRQLPSLLLLAAVFTTGSLALPHQQPLYDLMHCPNLMKSYRLSRAFPGVVAHGLHSITLEDLRHYFDPETPVENQVPTINLDLVSPHAVLGYAPASGAGSMFMTPGMKAVDQVLSHMDDPNWDVKKYSTLERMVHVMHMNEMWAMAKPYYDLLVANPPKDENICKCVTDIENNGILDMMNFMALKIREPELMYGQHLTRAGDSDRLKIVKEKAAEQGSEESKLDWHDIIYRFNGKEGEENEPKTDDNAEEKLDWHDIIYQFNGKEGEGEEAKSSDQSEEKLDWHDIIYRFNGKEGEENAPKAASNAEEKLDWHDIIYRFNGKEGEENIPANAEEKLDWHDIIYRFNGKEGEDKEAESIDQAEEKLDWHDIIYRFNGKDSEEKTPMAIEDGQEQLNWEANVYKFDFKDGGEEADSDNFAKQKGMPRLNSELAWKYWRSLVSGMDESENYELAMFLFCALKN